ncbi:CBS domain-containing protein YkuL [Lentibacillus sp. JNUCC-1]|uniref:cyclic-di-AMP-binding protein CbpB n=1 Tax=Lentibacillus sp. JNUCC-1 TaxID=2654513 RepID=UPI0012E972D2|nr:cyclic-di-AMP-binding protein CbpB [Lentibacillus sp. JNUCC-1]MUV36286.1 CBS domain-containing protein YkuL [Lentibacillus sp. JNUCC-1]
MEVIQDRTLNDIVVEDMMIPSEKVAHVQLNNPLEHALLVLVKSGYSAVPVLDTSFKFVGIIGKTVILNQTLGMEQFEVDKLSTMRVSEVMHTDIPTLSAGEHFISALKKVINHPFVCVTDEEDYFIGILTRRAILKAVQRNYFQDK